MNEEFFFFFFELHINGHYFIKAGLHGVSSKSQNPTVLDQGRPASNQ